MISIKIALIVYVLVIVAATIVGWYMGHVLQKTQDEFKCKECHDNQLSPKKNDRLTIELPFEIGTVVYFSRIEQYSNNIIVSHDKITGFRVSINKNIFAVLDKSSEKAENEMFATAEEAFKSAQERMEVKN